MNGAGCAGAGVVPGVELDGATDELDGAADDVGVVSVVLVGALLGDVVGVLLGATLPVDGGAVAAVEVGEPDAVDVEGAVVPAVPAAGLEVADVVAVVTTVDDAAVAVVMVESGPEVAVGMTSADVDGTAGFDVDVSVPAAAVVDEASVSSEPGSVGRPGFCHTDRVVASPTSGNSALRNASADPPEIASTLSTAAAPADRRARRGNGARPADATFVTGLAENTGSSRLDS